MTIQINDIPKPQKENIVRDSSVIIAELIESLIAREHEVPEHGKDFEIIEKRENDSDSYAYCANRLDDFILQIEPAFGDPDTQRLLQAATTDSGGFITVSLELGTTKEVFDFLKTNDTQIKLEKAFDALFRHKLSMD